MNDLTRWVISELSSLLQFPVTEDMAKCILMIESNRDLEDYLKTLVDYSNPQHQKFVKELLRRKPLDNFRGYKKHELENYVDPAEVRANKKKGKNKGEQKKANQQEESPKEEKEGSGKKKTKFVNLFAHDDVILLKGRHPCRCQASKHKLINNCLKCGRIVCEQEGSGPCLFCLRPVYSREELQKNPQLSKMMHGDEAGLQSAISLKEKLLEYDKSSEQRTKVIDDESDYFSTNSVWLPKEMKEELKRKEEELQKLKHSRAARSLMLDFTGRCIIDEEFKKLNLETAILDEVSNIYDSFASGGHGKDNVDPKNDFDIELFYEESSEDPLKNKGKDLPRFRKGVSGRVQDRETLQMCDNGACLSMHQPWATLLISGIKKDEGRSWYTSHRGRLWIAATAKIPTKEDIDEVLGFYRRIRGDDAQFPKKFPTGCLLGCVTMVDCLAQEEYRQINSNGECDDAFVFVCEDPISSPVLFPIKGKHKIYQLDKNIHQAAVKCLQKLGKM